MSGPSNSEVVDLKASDVHSEEGGVLKVAELDKLCADLNGSDEVPEAASSSVSSSEIASHEDTEGDCGCSDSLLDPYSDVRTRMEELAARDKAIHALHTAPKPETAENHDDILASSSTAFSTYLAFFLMILVGRVKDLVANLFGRGRYVRRASDRPSDDITQYAPLLNGWDNFFTRRMYHRIQDCFNRPVGSSPGAHIDVIERVSSDGNKSMDLLGTLKDLDTDHQRNEYESGTYFLTLSKDRVARRCLNMGSYNYLGFADDWQITCKKDVMESLDKYGVSCASSRLDFGTTALHREVETTVSEFLGKEDAVAFTMGFNTNATTIPALVGRGDLIVSDELNHTSIVNGARASGASIRVFRHNSAKELDTVLKEAIVMGRPRTRRPWRRILVIVEGVYSMEGEYCDLKNIVKVCKKYGAYVYLDEAHSIGAVGPSGRGVAELCGVDTKDIDVMMGTFTKSFGGMGGYIAASKEIIQSLRQKCAGSLCHNSLSPIVCQQVVTSFKVIMGQDGTDIGKQKIQALRDNSNYMRMRLRDMGLLVLGHYDSPIMPVMLYHPSKMSAFSRECMKRGLAVVVVGFPAVPLLLARTRFCISAGHTRSDLDRALKEIQEIAELCGVVYGEPAKDEK